MDIIRRGFDFFYSSIKPIVFNATKSDPEKAHDLFVNYCKFLYACKLDKIVLDNKTNYRKLSFDISNAAGFNKNAEIPPSVLKYLGFDRVVVGTLTYKPLSGNSKPRIMRYPKKESLVNWTGLPNDGAEKIAERLISYGNHGVPLTISISPTPDKKECDLEKTVNLLKDVPYFDRFELNISCPNIRNDYCLEDLLGILSEFNIFKELYIKASPNLNENEIEEVLGVSSKFHINGFTITNTTTSHDFEVNGGASGDAVYKDSLNFQKMFIKKINEMNKYTNPDLDKNFKIVVCGGINSVQKIKERLSYGNVEEVQIYTPLVFSGPALLRKFRCYED